MLDKHRNERKVEKNIRRQARKENRNCSEISGRSLILKDPSISSLNKNDSTRKNRQLYSQDFESVKRTLQAEDYESYRNPNKFRMILN